MATLYKRATPRQALVLRMVEGACRNAAHAHPGQPLDERLIRGISKRAAGTLTSQWGSVLAAPMVRSEGENGDGTHRSAAGDKQCRPIPGQRSRHRLTGSGGASPPWRAPLFCLHKTIGTEVGNARRAGQSEREAALKDVLRLLARVMVAAQPPKRGERLVFARDLAAQDAMVEFMNGEG